MNTHIYSTFPNPSPVYSSLATGPVRSPQPDPGRHSFCEGSGHWSPTPAKKTTQMTLNGPSQHQMFFVSKHTQMPVNTPPSCFSERSAECYADAFVRLHICSWLEIVTAVFTFKSVFFPEVEVFSDVPTWGYKLSSIYLTVHPSNMTAQVIFRTICPILHDDAVWIRVLAFNKETLIGPMGTL